MNRQAACRWTLLCAWLLCAAGAQAQQAAANGLLLIARPELADPNFARTVVLVTRAEDDSAVGVILNRPTTLRLAELLRRDTATTYQDPVYLGGPVAQRTLVAVLRSGTAPAAASFRVLADVYLTMHPDNLARLLGDRSARYRLYAGFAGWLPQQLESEMMRDSWYFLQADEATLFRKTTEGLWEELLDRARRLAPRAANGALQ